MLQNATPLRKSAPGWKCLLRYACHVKCIFADPRQRPTPAIVFVFANFWEGAESVSHATHNNIQSSKMFKNGPRLSALTFLTSKCVLRHSCAHFFNHATSKNGANMWCFHHLFSSKRASHHTSVIHRALFRPMNAPRTKHVFSPPAR